MEHSEEIITSLKREYTFCANALAFYKKTLRDFERKYKLTTGTFLKKFETGQLGDDSDYFDWYAFAKLFHQWQATLTALRSANK